MKKILGITLLSLVALTACGSDDNETATGATVCTSVEIGQETTTTIYEENGYLTRMVIASPMDVSDMSEEEIESTIEFFENTEGMEAHLEGDYLITTIEIAAEDMGEEDILVAEIIEDFEDRGETCS